MRVALLGTGTMGIGMAHALLRDGHEVVAWNRTTAKAAPLADDGAEVADSVTSAVTGADAVVTMLFDADAVLSVTDEIVAALGPEAVWLQSSTVGPEGIRRIAEKASGAALLDAPVLGTKQPAEDGKLTPLVSGDPALVERARPVLDAIGVKTVIAGEQLGDGSALKLACNAWVLSVTAATAQSIALARGLGLDGSLFLDAIAGGASDTPYAHVKGKAMLEDEYSPQFGLDGGRKDLRLIAQAAASSGVYPAVLAALEAVYDRASDAGFGQEDLAAVFKAFR